VGAVEHLVRHCSQSLIPLAESLIELDTDCDPPNTHPTLKPPEPTVAAVVRQQTGVAWSRARRLCTEGRVTLNGQRCLDPASRVAPGTVVAVDQQAPKLRTGPLAESALVFYDRDVVVVHKPAGMLSVADEPGNKETIADYTRTLLRRMGGPGVDSKLGVVHRLDKDTSGLVVFARTATAKRILAAQFRQHTVDRVYHAIAHGAVIATRVETYLLVDRGDGMRGSFGYFRRPSGDAPIEAKRSVTHIRPIAGLVGATLVECRLETGRQHQIRIHLSELGHPLVGERVYIRDYAGLKIEAIRPMLHARTLGFVHPRTAERILFEREPPDDFQATLESLRPTRR
jgi:23S rRNA pseudouridine1911/1915/1917 synthase